MTFSCNGCTRIKLYGERLTTHGTGTVALDGDPTPDVVDFTDDPLGQQQLIYDSGVLSNGDHTIVLKCTSGYVTPDFVNVTD